MIRRKWSPKEIALGGALLLAVVGLLTFYVWYQTEAVYLGVEIGKREADIKALRDEILKLELKKTGLLTPARVDKIARADLGLVDPLTGEIIYKDKPASR
jgi:cell division protein FtsL